MSSERRIRTSNRFMEAAWSAMYGTKRPEPWRLNEMTKQQRELDQKLGELSSAIQLKHLLTLADAMETAVSGPDVAAECVDDWFAVHAAVKRRGEPAFVRDADVAIKLVTPDRQVFPAPGRKPDILVAITARPLGCPF